MSKKGNQKWVIIISLNEIFSRHFEVFCNFPSVAKGFTYFLNFKCKWKKKKYLLLYVWLSCERLFRLIVSRYRWAGICIWINSMIGYPSKNIHFVLLTYCFPTSNLIQLLYFITSYWISIYLYLALLVIYNVMISHPLIQKSN